MLDIQTRWVWLVVAVLTTIALVVGFKTQPIEEGVITPIHEICQGIAPFLTGCIALFYVLKHAREGSSGRTTLGWGVISLAGFLFFWSRMVYVTYGHGREMVQAVQESSFVLSSASCLFWAIGMVLLTYHDKWWDFVRSQLDTAIVTVSFGALIWHGFLSYHYHALPNPIEDIAVINYLISCGVLCNLAVAGLYSKKSPQSHRQFFLHSTWGILIMSVTAFAFAISLWQGDKGNPAYTEVPLVLGWSMLGVGVWQANRKRADEFAIRLPKKTFGVRTRNLGMFSPYVAMSVAMLQVTFSDWTETKRFMLFDHQEIGVLLALSLVRQFLMMWDNSHLTQTLDANNKQLSNVVEHLRSQNRFLGGIADTLDRYVMLQHATQHVHEALEANGVILFFEERQETLSEFVSPVDSHVRHALVKLARQQQVQSAQYTETEERGKPVYAHVETMMSRGKKIGWIMVIRAEDRFEPSDTEWIRSVGVELSHALWNAYRHELALEQADEDSVTGLLNHRAFHVQFERAMQEAAKNQDPLPVAMVDLNNFKFFNDTYGHLAGDAVLRHVAFAIEDQLPEHALVARYGGDEFCFCLPGATDEDLEHYAIRVHNWLSDHPYEIGDSVVPVTLTFGIACYPDDGKNRYEVLDIADRNLYEARGSELGISRTSEFNRQNRALRLHASFETLDALVSAVDNKDRYTRKHSEDVTEYAIWIAEELGSSEEAMKTIRRAGLLHDVGKIGVPDAILRKPGKLTPEEFEIIQRHPRLGELIVSAIPGMEDIVPGVRSHHERFDGSGYPDQLAGEDIPFLGRLLAVADAFSAMTTDRPYRKGMEWNESLRRIEEGIGTQFDPVMVGAFLRAVQKRYPELRGNADHLKRAA